MTETKAMFLFALFSLVFSATLFVVGILDAFSGAALGYVIGGIFFPWAAIRIQHVWKGLSPAERTQDYSFSEVRRFFMVSAIFTSTAIIPHYLMVLWGADIKLITIVNWLSHVLLTLQIILGARMVVSLYNHRWVSSVTVGLAFLGILSLLVNVMFPDVFVHIQGSRYPLLQPSQQFSFFQQALIFFGITLPSINLLIQAIRVRAETRVKRTAALLGGGFLLGVLTAVVIDYGTGLFAAVAVIILVTLYPFTVSLAGIRMAQERRERTMRS